MNKLKQWSLIVAMALSCCMSAEAARLALVVGNDRYAEIKPLKNAGNDARLVAQTLREAGFEVAVVQDVDRQRFFAALDNFQKRIAKGDEVVFFYAGHGVQVGGNSLLLPVDIRADSAKAAERESVPLVYVQDALVDARVSLLVIDACRDNPFPKEGRGMGETRGLARPEPAKGQAIILSAGRGQKALDAIPGSSRANSLFTSEFVSVMRTGVDVRAGLLKLRDQVEDKARVVSHEQRPTLVDELRGDFFIFSRAASGPQATPTPSGTDTAQLQADIHQEAWAHWQALMKADYDKVVANEALTPQDWDRFLVRWSENNPLSTEDEALRAQATLRRQRAQQAAAGERACVKGVCIELVAVPGGEFLMGSPESEEGRNSDEGPQHPVKVRTFLLGKYEVTQGQWTAVMGSNPSYFSKCGNECPVENVSWNDAQEFIRKLNAATGEKYRLPSEAEWEYGARGGTKTAFSTGKRITTSQANFGGNFTHYREGTVKVGGFAANGFGLYDMHGNVDELVQDAYHESYRGAPVDGSAWDLGEKNARRVLRGGSWNDSPRILRSACRDMGSPINSSFHTGFRIARTF